MTTKATFLRHYRWRCAMWFGGSDLLLLLGIYAIAELKRSDSVPLFGAIWTFSEWMARFWNLVHFPIRQVLEPILFPTVTAHPLSPNAFVWLLYFTLCIGQFVLLGYLVGLAIEKRRR